MIKEARHVSARYAQEQAADTPFINKGQWCCMYHALKALAMCRFTDIKQMNKWMVILTTKRVFLCLYVTTRIQANIPSHFFLNDWICRWPRENNSGKRVKGRQRRKMESLKGGSNFCVVQWLHWRSGGKKRWTYVLESLLGRLQRHAVVFMHIAS